MKKKVVPFARPDIGKKEIEAVVSVLKNGWLTMGQETVIFEQEFARYVGSPLAIAVNSCTSALFLSLKGLGVGQGDEVIIPSFTFAACANVVVHCGARVVFVDITPQNFTIDPQQVAQKLSDKTKAVMPVHYGGNQAATDFPVSVVEDSAHRVAPDYQSQNTVCYSFYATKNLTTGEGGMITTTDESLASWLVKARLHGLSRDAWQRYNPQGKWYYDIEFSGYKTNTIDMLSAMGRVQLSRLGRMEKKRKSIINRYNQHLGLNNQGTHLYPILVEKRNDFMEYMKENGISCSFHFLPLHKSPAFSQYNHWKLPVTEYVGSRVVTLPLFSSLTDEEVDYVCYFVEKFGSFKQREFGLDVLI